LFGGISSADLQFKELAVASKKKKESLELSAKDMLW
jgi:hypothetical protein